MRKQFVGVCAFGLFAMSLSAVGCAAETDGDDTEASQGALTDSQCRALQATWKSGFNATCDGYEAKVRQSNTRIEGYANNIKNSLDALERAQQAVAATPEYRAIANCIAGQRAKSCGQLVATDLCREQEKVGLTCAGCEAARQTAIDEQCIQPAKADGTYDKAYSDPAVQSAKAAYAASWALNGARILAQALLGLGDVNKLSACRAPGALEKFDAEQWTKCKADCSDDGKVDDVSAALGACQPPGFDVKCGTMMRSDKVCECKVDPTFFNKPCADYKEAQRVVNLDPVCTTKKDGATVKGAWQVTFQNRLLGTKKECVAVGD